MNNEIYKEGFNITAEERKVIEASGNYKYYADYANGYTAFALGCRVDAEDIVDKLNSLGSGDWFVGAEGEEYVFVN